MSMPRVDCPSCGRPTAAAPVADSLNKGRLWRHDAPGSHRWVDGALVSCPGSLAVVDLPVPVRQLDLLTDDAGQEHDDHDTLTLF